MSRELRIGDIASRTGRSIHTIRWYETQGLVPGVTRDRGGRRVYSDFHVGWLDLMERLRSTGMSVKQMREYAALAKRGEATLHERHALLSAHQQRVQDNIHRWSQALALIDAKVEFYNEWIVGGERPAVSPHGRLKAVPASLAVGRP
ncbi:MerR family transcriptional regulator [Bradyrhizobium sp. DOA9]|uniref:MerR family transcriptional regulator n=1 Tax=Bradyrhizobium sp. DOA9 TaxID=1126627 RepID=UPI0004685663|nr:MerR family transcriptional regulator [Bradyrhizobium sp. DOA9]GAJ35826.1 putative HTH-type transcriptional regulator HI0186 [Bradyrhizobium sp. DOA9]